MSKVYVCTQDTTVIYAAEELKKYLKMMRPECADVEISFDSAGTDGFRLGLMQDFGLDVSDVESAELDDILYIKTEGENGVIAGDNPRSVLLSVYEYLRRQGCVWLFPGVDGEMIPEKYDLVPVSMRYKPSMRYRGISSEGSIYQRAILEAIEFIPKLGMNYFMIEFRIPTSYYRRHYNHVFNDMNRSPEPVGLRTILKWKRQCEAEITKRGLIFADVGHGWAADALGIDSSLRGEDGDNEKRVPPENRQYLALVDGERKLVNNVPNWTHFCMSNAEARRKFVLEAVKYAKLHTNVSELHISLGDSSNKHCECEECVKKLPSDWFVILLNEIDEAFTREGLNTKLAFLAYTDTLWAPKTEKIKSRSRFLLEFCPITRSYTASVPTEMPDYELEPYVRNKTVLPKTIGENLAAFFEWRHAFFGPTMVFEYHMWRHQYLDVGNINLAKIISEDVKGYLSHGFMGIDENCSERSFFPTGFLFYVYARTMFDVSLSFEELKREYFISAFGDDGMKVADYLERLGKAIGFEYLEGERSDAPEDNLYFAPSHVESIKSAKAIIEEGRELIRRNYNMPERMQTYSVRLLEFHADYADMLSDVFIAKAAGDDDEADVRYKRMMEEMGKREIYFETCYDHTLLFYSFSTVINKRTKYSEPIIY
ncbi:MAG: DUF4838 domain-containing protein [Clostridia bacterium]|nr:DUF4838 domain-containing protein [Clostridia bacterium]